MSQYSLLLAVLALVSYVYVASARLQSRVKTYPSQAQHVRRPNSAGPAPAKVRRAVAIPSLVLMTAASTGEFQPDNALEVTHDFKLRIDAGREMCVFQKVRQNARLYVSFKVLAGADKKVDVIIQASDGNVVDQHRWTNTGTTDRLILHPGVYSVCVGNLASRFAAKLVDFFLATYVVEQLRQRSTDLQQFDDELNNVTESVEGVAGAVKDMLFQLQWSRQNYGADYYVVKNNNESVQLWSVLMCAMIVGTSALQVAFVRRLFHCPAHVTKERA